MKKLIFVCIFASFAIFTYGQRPQGHISIIPRVGLDIANMTGNEIYYYDSQKQKSMKSKYNARFAGGVDVEYQLLSNSSITLGAYYSQQGCRFPDYRVLKDETILESDKAENMEKLRWKLDYVQVPLMFNQYLTEGLAVKVGVQMGFLTKAKITYTQNNVTFDKDGSIVSENRTPMETDIKKTLRAMDFTIPVGASYEYQNVILDLRYNFGLKSIYKDKEMPKEKNAFLLFTVGYRLF